MQKGIQMHRAFRNCRGFSSPSLPLFACLSGARVCPLCSFFPAFRPSFATEIAPAGILNGQPNARHVEKLNSAGDMRNPQLPKLKTLVVKCARIVTWPKPLHVIANFRSTSPIGHLIFRAAQGKPPSPSKCAVHGSVFRLVLVLRLHAKLATSIFSSPWRASYGISMIF